MTVYVSMSGENVEQTSRFGTQLDRLRAHLPTIPYELGPSIKTGISRPHKLHLVLLTRQAPEDFRAWERNMQEEPNNGVWDSLSQQCREQHQMVIIDPD